MDAVMRYLGEPGSVIRLLVYAAVFIAICIPIACWRREAYVASELPLGDWKHLPSLFRLLWRPMILLETTLGQFFAMAFSGRAKKLAEQLEIAALPLTSRRLFVAKAVLAVVFALAGAFSFLMPQVSSGLAQIIVLVAALLGWMFPSLLLDSLAQKRQEEIVKSLPFAIDLMGSAMRAGLDFGASMRYYTGLGLGGALEEEFVRVVRDASLGKPIAESLQDMAARVKIKTFTAFAGVIAYGTEIGASISDTLKLHGAEMRRERFSLAEQKAARAPSVMIFPIVMFILPAVFLIIFIPVLLQFKATQGH